jgi:pseudaminic acid synthase
MSAKISGGSSVFIVAEISANHNQSFKIAAELIKKAKECGADAVKFQAYTPDTMTIDHDNKYFRIRHPQWGGQTLYELYKKAYTPWSWFKRLKKIADNAGIIFFATAFDRTSVDFLEGLHVPMHKIASFELIDLPLIGYAARTKKPLIMSTGMANLFEIKDAVRAAKNGGAKNIILLRCVSSYPAKPDGMNLRTIPHMKKLFNCPVGLSDHNLASEAAIAAVVLGAQVIEKHFTLSRKIKTPDNFFSIEPKEFKDLVVRIRMAEKALGKVHYGITADEKKNIVFRRSLFVIKDIKKGERLTSENVNSIRPGYGLPPKNLKLVLGKKAARDIPQGTPLRLDLIRDMNNI